MVVLLLKAYKDTGGNEYMSEIFERYYYLVFGLCLKYFNANEAEDTTLQIFEKLIENLHKHEIKNFSSWLHSVTRNECLMIIRQKSRAQQHELSYKTEMHIVAKDDELEQIQIKEIQLNLLEDAIGNLKNEQKLCIDLFYLQQKCYKEIEEITGFSAKEVKSHIQNGKRNLKLTLSQNNEIAV